MESLRWILLVIGAVFVVVIYFLGRSRKQRQRSMVDELEDDLPEFSAQDLADVDEGVGKVRIITRETPSADDFETDELKTAKPKTADLETVELYMADDDIEQTAEVSTEADSDSAGGNYSNIIVLYILAKGNQPLTGSQINSSAQAMGLSFGEMNIFHYKRNGVSVFSLANMLEPGSFDAEKIHELKTTGLTVFMQLKGNDPLDDLTEMLQRSYQLAGLLNARLCNHKRTALIEQDAENYRTQVRNFMAR